MALWFLIRPLCQLSEVKEMWINALHPDTDVTDNHSEIQSVPQFDTKYCITTLEQKLSNHSLAPRLRR